jgi:ABC-type multidrug transport system fused ATPase/permease subunit
MSETTTTTAGLGQDAQFDDRIDLAPDISNRESLTLIVRSLKLLAAVKHLFFAKLAFSAFVLIPGLVIPFASKIVIDQVLLQKHIDEIDVPFPPHIMPFVNAIRDLTPIEIMVAVTVLLGVMLILFGRGGTGVFVGGEGMDSATASENKLNAGGSRASGIIGILETYVDVRLHQRLANGLRTRLFKRLAHLSMSKLDDHRIGDSVYRVMYDAPDVPQICVGLTLGPLFTLVGVLISLYLIQYSYGHVSPDLVWVSGLMIPVGLLITLPASGLIRRVQQASRAAGTATTNAIEESMSNIQAVQSLGGMGREKSRIADKSSESYRRFRHVKLTQIGVYGVSFSLTIGLGLYVYFTVADAIIAGSMTPGDWGVLFGLALNIGGAGLSLGMIWINLQANTAAIRRVFFFIDMETEDTYEEYTALAPVREGVQFENVDFTYPNGQPALRDISVELAVGQLVAIVGPTGAGKTSLAYLIPGYYRPTRGQVLIDGVDIAGVNLHSLRSQVSYVFQEHLLMSESIRSNFELVKPNATDEDIWQACTTAGAREFVEKLPDGLDTVLGRSGDTLSVGQKQRLCIARGLVRNTPILILDEPTAALDPKTENALVQALRVASRNRLVIVIAHRLSTIRRADRIIFLDAGRVMDVGNHESLMADTGSAYRRFVELQGG